MDNRQDTRSKLVSVASYNDPIIADIDRLYLEANGVEATVMGGDSPYPSTFLQQPARLMVLECDEDRAKELLSLRDQSCDLPTSQDTEDS